MKDLSKWVPRLIFAALYLWLAAEIFFGTLNSSLYADTRMDRIGIFALHAVLAAGCVIFAIGHIRSIGQKDESKGDEDNDDEDGEDDDGDFDEDDDDDDDDGDEEDEEDDLIVKEPAKSLVSWYWAPPYGPSFFTLLKSTQTLFLF